MCPVRHDVPSKRVWGGTTENTTWFEKLMYLRYPSQWIFKVLKNFNRKHQVEVTARIKTLQWDVEKIAMIKKVVGSSHKSVGD